MDQAVAIIIASAISVVGAVGGSLGGVLISNHHTAMLEEKRIEHEKTQEKTRKEQEKLQKEQNRNRALLEELCSLVYVSQLDMFAPYLGEDNFSYSSVVKAKKNVDRIAVIVILYYGNFGQTFAKFQDSYSKLETIHDQIYQLRVKHTSLQDPKAQELLKQSVQASDDFAKIRAKFITEIRDLAKTMF